MPRGHAEHAADVDERLKGAVLETEHGRLFPRLLDDGALIERQRGKAREAVVREDPQNVAVDAAGHAFAHLVPERAGAVERAQIEERPAPRHLLDHGAPHPGVVAPAPFGAARHMEKRLEWRLEPRQVVARRQGIEQTGVAVSRIRAARAFPVDQHDVGHPFRHRFPAS